MLVLVGAMMMGETDQIEWRNMLVAVPAFLTIVVQPFTFSIANGIYAGLLMSGLVYLLTGAAFEAARDAVARLRGEGRGGGEPLDVLDASEAAFAGAPLPHGGGGARKDEGGLEAPLLGAGAGRGGSAADIAALASSLRPSDAISITQRRSRESITGASVSRSHQYERGSFGMLINTHPIGSHAAGGALGGASHPGGGSYLGSPQQH